MTHQVNPSMLSGVALFADLSAVEQTELAARLRRRAYARGAAIFYAGDPGTTLFIIESGSVRIGVAEADRSKQLFLALLGPGDFFGELALLDGEPRSADAVAHEPSELLLLERTDFLRFVTTRPDVTEKLLITLCRRLRQETQLLQDAAFLDVPGRLARVLLHYSDQDVMDNPEGRAPVQLTQVELAGIISATRESVNKWLRAYERQGVIAREKGRIVVLRPEALRRRLT